jgi:predicted nucleotidyltransferase
MDKINQIKQTLESQKKYLEEKYKIREIGIFGSYVRGEQKKKSDLDILVEFEEAPGLLTFLEIENYLSEILDTKVDLVIKDALKPVIGRSILKEVITV